MSIARAGTPGATRVCPHCKAVVLETAAVCPGCRHHLRFNAADAQRALAEAYSAFNIEGTITHRQAGEHCEYCIVLDIRNERGEQIIRQIVGVGALQPGELRRLSLAVEMLPVRATVTPKSEPSTPGRDARRGVPATPDRNPAPVPPVAVASSRPPAATPPATPFAHALSGKNAAAGAPATSAAKPAPPPVPVPKMAGSQATPRPAAPPAESQGPLSQRLRIFRKP